MKAQHGLILFLIPVWLLIAIPAGAQSLYFGLRGGPMFSDVRGMDEAVNIGLLLGYNFRDIDYRDDRIGSLSMELEGATTLVEGDVTTAKFFDGSWSIDTAGVFLAYRTPHTFYVKGKAGLEYVDISVSHVGDDFSDSGFGFSWGVGGGWRLTETYGLEVEYGYKTNLDFEGDNGDVSFLSVGMNFNF